jgi:4-amino-4-deoxy-L-arabinose transferase-like glycosyltransferase
MSDTVASEPSPSPASAGKRPWGRTFRLAIVVLILGLAAGMLLRTEGMLLKHKLLHDEAISYIAATGHLNAYKAAAEGGLTDRWVPAQQWKALMEPGAFWVFRGIESGLAHTDMHPPLYFWILHVWVTLFGVTLKGGIVLNMIIAALTGVSLFFLARRLLGNELEAAIVTAIWIVSPPVVATSMMARHYDLVALFTVLFALVIVKAADRARPLRARDLVLLAVVAAAGMLTHYQFALVLLTGAAYALAVLVRRDRKRLLKIIGGMLAGLPLFLVLDPTFYLSVLRHGQRPHQLTADVFVARFRLVRQSLGSFFGSEVPDQKWSRWSWQTLSAHLGSWGSPRRLPDRLVGSWLGLMQSLRRALTSGAAVKLTIALLLLFVVGLAIALLLPRWRPHARRYLAAVDTKGMFPAAFFLAGIAGSIIVMYLLVRSPFIYDRYLAAAWPFLAFAPVLAARLLVGRWRYVAIAAFCLVFVVPPAMGRLHAFYDRTNPEQAVVLARADRFVIDDQSRGNISRVMYWIPDDRLVYVSTLPQLLANKNAWLPALGPNDAYLALRVPGNTTQDFAAMKSLLARDFALVSVHYGIRGVGDLYVLAPKP